MGISDSYRRTYHMIRSRSNDLLMLLLANLVLFMVVQLFSFVVAFSLIFVAIVVVFASLLFGVLTVILLLLILLIILPLAFLLNSAMNGWSVYISEKVIKIRKGGSFSFSDILPDMISGWRHYLSRGFGMLMFQLFIISPILLLLISPLILIAVVLSIGTNHFESVLIRLAFQFLLMVLILPLQPVIAFIIDNGSVHIARGKGSWAGMFASVGDIFKRWRLFSYFYPGYLLISIISMFLGPLSMIVQLVLPILSKTYIVVNDDL